MTRPLGEGEGPVNWVAGWNQPGYLPETEPEYFEHYQDAKDYILDNINVDLDSLSWVDGEAFESLQELRHEIIAETDEFDSRIVGGLVYWVLKANRGI